MSSQSRTLPHIGEKFREMKNLDVKRILRSTEEYLTPLSLRVIVDYILLLEEENGR
ncbi:MAG: hypothetical protein J7L34_00715 [Thermotogaceae bacterium]|nr:hypothetical protein [Thermotogaceae bacterium]